jgi:hypothetical protein
MNNYDVGRHEKCLGEIRNAYKILIRKLEYLGVDGRIRIKINLLKRSVAIWI